MVFQDRFQGQNGNKLTNMHRERTFVRISHINCQKAEKPCTEKVSIQQFYLANEPSVCLPRLSIEVLSTYFQNQVHLLQHLPHLILTMSSIWTHKQLLYCWQYKQLQFWVSLVQYNLVGLYWLFLQVKYCDTNCCSWSSKSISVIHTRSSSRFGIPILGSCSRWYFQFYQIQYLYCTCRRQ